MNVQLIVVEGRPLGAAIPLKPGRFLIGRDGRCQLRPRSATVSQFHCVLRRQGGRITVEDLGSSNGTLVNAHLLGRGERVALQDGDRLQVGQLTFAIRTEAESESVRDPSESWPSDPGDPAGQTMLVSALGGRGDDVPPDGPEWGAATPGGRFSYRTFDVKRRAMVLGLSWLQVSDEREMRAARRALRELVDGLPSRRLVLDLAEVEGLPGAGAALILVLAQRCRQAGGALRLCGMRPDVERMLDALRLDGLVDRFDDRRAALAEPWG